MKLYRYLYYRLYTWNLKTWGEKDLPQWNALFGVSFMMGLNLGTIAGIIDMIGVVNIFVENPPKNEIILFAFVILFTNYFWLLHNGKYKQIAKDYRNETKNKKLLNTLFLWLYVLVSFMVFSFIAILSGKLKGLQ